MSERLDPEDLKEMKDLIFGEIVQLVTKYDGFVERVFGDEVLAFFGVPNSQEDDAVRAIQAAEEIHELVKTKSIEFEDKVGQPLRMHSGINTGLIITGKTDVNKGQDGFAGRAINIASRLTNLASPDEILVGPETYRRTEGFFIFEELGSKTLKGKDEPMDTYRVLGPSKRTTRFDISIEQGLTPFVGRKRELGLLLDSFAQSKQGRNRAVSIVSEAGVGKSRLLYEFKKTVANEDVMLLEAKCLSYSRGVAYQPVIDILKSTFNIIATDGDIEVRAKLKQGLEDLNVDDTQTLPFLLQLLGIKGSGVDEFSLSPEARRDQLIGALKRIAIGASQVRPLIMAIEDLHWMDKSSEDVFKTLLGGIAGARILLIFTYRNEYAHTWEAKSYHRKVNLKRLSRPESVAMVTYLLDSQDIDSKLEALMLEKTEGVPFFIEEFIKSIVDLKIVEKINNRYRLRNTFQKVSIPSTIQGIIMARVDSLHHLPKKILQIASVIEREFRFDLIHEVCELSKDELLSQLAVLKSARFIYERGSYPECLYIFKHSLIQELVCESILLRRKKELHNEIGEAIEKLYKVNLHEYYGVLTEHFIAGENYIKAASYAKLAGKKAEKAASLVGAIEFTKKRIKCLERLPQTDVVQKGIVDARTLLGLYFVQMGYHTKAKEAVASIVEVAIAQDYKRRLSQIYTILGTYSYLVQEDFTESFDYLEKSLKISEESNDVVSALFANFWSAIVRSVNCEHKRAIRHIEKALEINEKAESLWGISVIKSNLSYFVYYFQGRIDRSYQVSNEALQAAKKSGDIFSKAMAFVSHGIACYGKGLFEEAIMDLSEGSIFCEKINLVIFHAIAQFYLGEVFFEIGKFEQAQHHYSAAKQLLEKNAIITSWKNVFKLALEKSKMVNNKTGISYKSLDSFVRENKAKIWDGWICGCIAQILLNKDDEYIADAEKWINKAIQIDQENGVYINLGSYYSFYAELLKRKNDNLAVREKLNKAIEIFHNYGADGWTEKYKRALESY